MNSFRARCRITRRCVLHDNRSRDLEVRDSEAALRGPAPNHDDLDPSNATRYRLNGQSWSAHSAPIAHESAAGQKPTPTGGCRPSPPHGCAAIPIWNSYSTGRSAMPTASMRGISFVLYSHREGALTVASAHIQEQHAHIRASHTIACPRAQDGRPLPSSASSFAPARTALLSKDCGHVPHR